MTNLRWIPLSLLAAVLLFAVACGGGDDDDNGATGATASGSPAASASTGGSSTGGSSTGSAPSTSTGGSQDGTLDIKEVAQGLENVDSFRFNVKLALEFDAPQDATGSDAAAAAFLMALLGNVEAEGAFVAPDRISTKSSFFGSDIETIQIGEEVWTNDGTGWAVADPLDFGSSMPIEVTSPSDLFDVVPEEQLAGAKTSKEKVNGVDTTRYSFDKEALADLAQDAGDSGALVDLSEIDALDLDIWLTEDGLPVKMVMKVEGVSEGAKVSMSFEINITDLNDSSIKIERPI